MHWYIAISAKHWYRQIRRHILMAPVHVSACHCIWLFISYCGLLWLICLFVGRGFLPMNKHWEKAFTCRRYGSATLPLVRWKMNPSQLLSSSACLLSFKHISSWLSDYTQRKNSKDLYFLHSFCFSQLLWLCPFPLVLLTSPSIASFLRPPHRYLQWWSWQIYIFMTAVTDTQAELFCLHNHVKCRYRQNSMLMPRLYSTSQQHRS